VYRTDWLGIAAAGARWLATMTFGWAARRSPRGLLDNAPLAHLLQRELSFHRIEQMLESRLLHALSITALSYSSGRHLTFYQAAEPIQAWRRAQRTARLVDLSASHLLASSAIPFVFPRCRSCSTARSNTSATVRSGRSRRCRRRSTSARTGSS
jgi:NTE family protein